MKTDSSPHRLPHGYTACGLTAFVVFAVAVSGGCSKEKIKQVYQDAKAKTEEYTEEYTDAVTTKVEESLPEFGSIVLRSRDPIKEAESASIELIDIGDGRPVSVQISSYDTSSGQKTYPAIFFQGQTTAKSYGELANTTMSCDMYLQSVPSGRIAMTPDGGSARIKFGEYDAEGGTIQATLSRIDLDLSNGKTFSVDGGDIVALVKEQS